ncbi:MAG TPA: transporter [Rhodospirillaceae bacterium]|nr:transporter [Rhodospirillaceae bacterium]
MGAITPVLQVLPTVLQGASLVSKIVSNERSAKDQSEGQDLALRQLQERQAEQQKQLQEDAALERQQISLSAEAEERKRRDALRRAVARQRASFGASGISSSGGSAEAVLLGLFDETEAERAEREKLDALRFGALDQGLDQQKRLDVIQRTQFQESQKIGRLTASADRATDRINAGLSAVNFAGNLF